MEYTYKTSGTCSRAIHFDINDGIISNVSFDGGCNGNLKAVSALVDGKDAAYIAGLLSGIKCGFKNTSCGDQLARAVTEAAEAEKAGKAQ